VRGVRGLLWWAREGAWNVFELKLSHTDRRRGV
jgi:hypothetical protein